MRMTLLAIAVATSLVCTPTATMAQQAVAPAAPASAASASTTPPNAVAQDSAAPALATPATPATALPLGEDGIRTEATVVVTGEQPGPGLWLVRKGGNELYILGTLNPLPARMQLSSSGIDAVISRAQEVIRSPSVNVGTDASKLRLLMLAPSLIGIRNNPDRKTLQDVMPATLYVRWHPFKQRFMPGDDGVEKMRPMFAAEALYRAAIKRSGMTWKDPSTAAVNAAIEKHHPSVSLVKLELKVKDPKSLVKQMKTARFDDLACMERTLDRLGVDMEVFRLRANAWATGDIATLRANPVASQSKACLNAVTESAIGERIGMGNAEARVRTMWLAKAEQALAKNTTTFAILPMDEILDAGGSLDLLRAKGYSVLAPDE